jgi:hypothetical protein
MGTSSEVSPPLDGLAHGAFVQASTLYDYAEALCAAAKTSMASLVRAQYFVPAVVDFPGIAAAWSARCGNRPQPFVCVEVPSPMPAPGAAIIADFWIYAP